MLLFLLLPRDTPFFTTEMVKRLEVLSYKFFIDLSVPRSIEAEVENIPGVLVYNIDTIQNKATAALESTPGRHSAGKRNYCGIY